MCDEDLVKILKRDFGFWESTAIAFLESEGRCVYCDEDLFSERVRYASHNVEHLYPRVNFPELANEQVNLVLSCFKCNNLKRGKEIYPPTDDPLTLLSEDKAGVIQHIRDELRNKIEKDKEICRNLNDVLPWT